GAAAIVFLLVASLVVSVLILIYRPLPTIEGDIRLLGIDQRVEVLRDSYGVPHIYAKTVHDLFYMQGYVTAQDRLFQMDLYRRAGSGRLAEVLGEPALEADRQMRTFGFARVAAQELALVREDTRAGLQAYAADARSVGSRAGDRRAGVGRGRAAPLTGCIGSRRARARCDPSRLGRGERIELLGPRRLADRERQATPRRRSAPRRSQSLHLV